MRFSRIHILGASGAGTTTLGAALAAHLGYSHFDADDYFWAPTVPPFQVKIARDERLRTILEDLSNVSKSVLSGAVSDWGASLEDSFDLIIFLRIPPAVRLARLRAREITRHGAVSEEFIAWAAQYDHGDLSVRSRLLQETWLSRRRCEILRLEEDMSVEDRLRAVLQKATSPPDPSPTPPA